MKNYILLCLGLLCLSFTGCASIFNDWDAKGGIIGTYRGDYIVVNQTGGVIADVWILENRFVESEDGSDGWRFKDDDNNMIHVSGDAKVLRLDSKATLRLYREYHMEFETQTYQEKYGHLKVAARYHLRNRTNRFFERSKATEVAARYHLRGRTSRFFERSKATEVASRYHQRKRSGRFFDRVRRTRTRTRGVC
jgi:hypothetical protein